MITYSLMIYNFTMNIKLMNNLVFRQFDFLLIQQNFPQDHVQCLLWSLSLTWSLEKQVLNNAQAFTTRELNITHITCKSQSNNLGLDFIK